MLRSDYGTENVNLATLQIAFRLGHGDDYAGRKSFLYGPSPGNIVCIRYNACIIIPATGLSMCRELNVFGPNYVDLKPSGGLNSVR